MGAVAELGAPVHKNNDQVTLQNRLNLLINVTPNLQPDEEGENWPELLVSSVVNLVDNGCFEKETVSVLQKLEQEMDKNDYVSQHELWADLKAKMKELKESKFFQAKLTAYSGFSKDKKDKAYTLEQVRATKAAAKDDTKDDEDASGLGRQVTLQAEE